MFERAVSKFIKSFAFLICSIITLIFAFIFFFNTLTTQKALVNGAKETTTGTVVKCVEKDASYFSNTIEYQVYVSVPYTYKDKDYTMYNCYSLSNDAWGNYSVGDTFDASTEKYLDCDVYTEGQYKLWLS